MKFEVERQDLAAAIAKCLKATVEKSHHTPFRACRIETDGKEQIRFFAFSETMHVDTLIPGTVLEAGGCTVSPFSLNDIISVLPKGKVVMKADKKLQIKSKEHKRNYTLSFIECEMRRLEEPPGPPWPMNALELIEAWETVHASVAAEGGAGSHNIVPSAQLVVTANGFSLAGANGRALIRIEYSGKFKAPGSVLVPRRAFQVLQLLGQDDQKVNVSADHQRVYWENSDTLSACALVGETNQDGSRAYPPVEPVIDIIKKELDSSPSVTVSAAQMVEALRAVAAVAEKQASVKIIASGTSLLFEVESETGSGSEELSIDPSGEFSVFVDIQLAKDVLSPLKDKSIKMAHVSAQNCLVVTSENVFALISTRTG